MTEAELKEIGDRNLFRGGGDEGCRCSTCDASRLVAEVRRLRAALVGIAGLKEWCGAKGCEDCGGAVAEQSRELARAALEGK